MLSLIRFSGTDYSVYLSFREFADACIAPDLYGPASKLTDLGQVYFRPMIAPAYMRDGKTAYVAYERMLASMKRIRAKIVSAYDLDEDEAAMLQPWNIEKVVPVD